MPDGMLIQNYAQWSSATETGKYDGMSCNVRYEDDNGVGDDVTIFNYSGTDSLRNEDGANGRPWTQGTFAEEWEWFEKEDDPEELEAAYGRTYAKRDSSSQKCGASALAHYTEDGEPVDMFKELNESYWKIKNTGSVTLWTGVRGYTNPNGSADWYVDAPEVTYTFWDFGLEDPNGGVIMPDASELVEDESGATALLSVAATTLAAVLMM